MANLKKGTAEYQEKLELYLKARDAYYGTGEQIMTDIEFDELEVELGLENSSNIGSSRTENYTVKHPFVQGTLSKVQIKRDSTGNINFKDYWQQVLKYLNTSNTKLFEVTPKLDGVSFEFCVLKNSPELPQDFKPVVSTRGNGFYGKNISDWFTFNHDEWSDLFEIYKALNDGELLVIRGEILVDKEVFAQKYAKEFVNTRSFVSGVIGTDWEETPENLQRKSDLSWLCYDYRIVKIENGSKSYTELSWDNAGVEYKNRTYAKLGNRPNLFRYSLDMFGFTEFSELYDTMADMRSVRNLPGSEYSLDGFVIKPDVNHRIQNFSEDRPKECVAIKFCPMMLQTTIRNIVWEIGKTGEYYPVGICDPIVLDNKQITRVSLHNYYQVLMNGTGIGAEILVSLAGDIIPYVFKVIKPVTIPEDIEDQVESLKLPDFTAINETEEGQKHLMGAITPEVQFVNSANTLEIFGIGGAIAQELFVLTGSKHTNILDILNEESYQEINNNRGADQQSTKNIIASLKEYAKKVSLQDIIISQCYNMCGRRCSTKCAEYIQTRKANFSHFPKKAYSWVYDETSAMYIRVMDLAKKLGVPAKTAQKEQSSEEDVKIPVILTGDTKNTPYATKKEWLAAHPEYVETSSWSECKILFTNDMESTSSKMQKAKKKNIEIRLY